MSTNQKTVPVKKKRKPITKVHEDRRTLAWRRKSSYAIWYNILMRCTDPKHKAYGDYGGRGIRVHKEWVPSPPTRTAAEAFRNFLRDVGIRPNQKLSLDRIDPNGNYEPDNTQWATDKEQARNKRESIYLQDPLDPTRMMPAAELAERLGLRYQTLRYRYQRMNKWPSDMVVKDESGQVIEAEAESATVTASAIETKTAK